MTTIRKAGVIGWPIKHSRSPLIHSYWLKQLGIEGRYEKIAVEPENLPAFISTLSANDFQGINVTIPHKEAVLALADKQTDEAKTIGAANTLWFEQGQLIAGNTDGYGFLTHLKNSAEHWQQAKPAMVLGAGGAARAIIYALIGENVPEIILTNRTRSRAEELASHFQNHVRQGQLTICDWEEKEEEIYKIGLLVNTTSLGMSGNQPLEIDLTRLPAYCICYDIVYTPLETNLLRKARARGLVGVDGLGMLIHQAAPGFEKWFGIQPIVTNALFQLLITDLEGQ